MTKSESKDMACGVDWEAFKSANAERHRIKLSLENLKLTKTAFVGAVLETIKASHPELPPSRIKLTISATGAREDFSIEYEKVVQRVVYDKPIVGVLRFDEKCWRESHD